MFRILIVDPEKDFSDFLTTVICRAIEGVRITTVESQEEATRLIIKKENPPSGNRPHAIIVSPKLSEEGSLCGEINDHSPTTHVFHLVCHDNINCHLVQYHTAPGTSRAVIQAIDGIVWQYPLVNKLCMYLGSDWVIHCLQALSAPSHEGRGCATHRIADAQIAIARFWDYLDPRLKEKLREEFYVDDSHQPVTVSLMSPGMIIK